MQTKHETFRSSVEQLKRLLAEATPGPWRWFIEDHSMATLCGADELHDHVMSVSPCSSCMVEGKSPIGKCTMPDQNTADLIAALRNLAPSLIAAAEENEQSHKTIELLRDELMNPPPDIQERVLRQLGIWPLRDYVAIREENKRLHKELDVVREQKDHYQATAEAAKKFHHATSERERRDYLDELHETIRDLESKEEKWANIKLPEGK